MISVVSNRTFVLQPDAGNYWCNTDYTLPDCQRTDNHKCGAEGDRTPDLLVANQALSQLSYSPAAQAAIQRLLHFPSLPPDVGLSRVELLTSRLSGVRSNHLSYRPISSHTK